jgi:hypothetical protein
MLCSISGNKRNILTGKNLLQKTKKGVHIWNKRCYISRALVRRAAESTENFQKILADLKKVLDKAKWLRYNNKATHPKIGRASQKRASKKFKRI